VSISRRSFIVGGVAAGVLAACAKTRRHPVAAPASTTTAPAHSDTVPEAQGPATFVRQGRRDSGEVALTFHGSGDVGLVTQLLDQAKARKAPITVFAVGQWLEANPQMASRILGDGHELANHTYTHPALATVSHQALTDEIVRCRDVLLRLSHSDGRWFRPSGVDIPTSAMLVEAGRAGYTTVVGYNVDPLDYQDPGAAAIVSRVKANLAGGAIISLHTGHAGTVAAFGPIVDAIHGAGLAPVTVGNLLA
jgi:peptidoglycan/xylan/chitin deacetylase (PgdA/CDA1 family)